MIPFFDYPPETRKVIYTTNAIESVNMRLRKITKNSGSFPSDEALSKLFYLALKNISKKWNMPIRGWEAALNLFSIEFKGRVPQQWPLTPFRQKIWHPLTDQSRRLDQLTTEGLSSLIGNRYLVSWDAVYRHLSEDDFAS